jgi:hypothetical protein
MGPGAILFRVVSVICYVICPVGVKCMWVGRFFLNPSEMSRLIPMCKKMESLLPYLPFGCSTKHDVDCPAECIPHDGFDVQGVGVEEQS